MNPQSTVRADTPSAATLRDRRAHRRLSLQVFVEIASDAEPGRVIEKGVTADISSGGLRFPSFNWRQLPVGRRFRVTVSVPFESVIFTDRRRLTARATVVRWMDERPAGARPRMNALPGVPPLRRNVAVRFEEPLVFASSA